MSENGIMDLIDLTLEDSKDLAHRQSASHKTDSNFIPSIQKQEMLKPIKLVPSSIVNAEPERESLDNNPFDRILKLADRAPDPFEFIEKEAIFKASSSSAEVRMERLLSLSSDSLIEDKPFEVDANVNIDSTIACDLSTLSHSAFGLTPINDSPVEVLPNKITSNIDSIDLDSGEDSASSTEASNSAKTKKPSEHRKQLLKLSISNSAFNSPVCYNVPSHKDLEHEKKFSPLTALFNQAAHCGEFLLSAESPVKLICDDDIFEKTPILNDDEEEFNADLELLKIPVLMDLPLTTTEDIPLMVKSSVSTAAEDQSDDTLVATKLAEFHEKLRSKREETNNNQDVSKVIQDLKNLISIVDDKKKEEAAVLLGSLMNTLASNNEDKTDEINDSLPNKIIRQDTFDLDLSVRRPAEEISANLTESTLTGDFLQPNEPMEECPDVMVKSSATYDGEMDERRDTVDIERPEVDPLPLSPIPRNNDILVQINKLLGQFNPDLKVVSMSSISQTSSDNQTNHANNLFNDKSPNISNSSLNMRRRSQSFSLGDKAKNRNMPLAKKDQSSLLTAQRMGPPDGSEFKTPSRVSMRRNSFSSVTPSTPKMTGLNRNSYGTEVTKTKVQSRYSHIPTTNSERQQPPTTIRPMQVTSTNLSSFKPDLKKKVRSSDSVMRSLGPLKATIPITTVLPMIKCSPPTPSRKTASDREKNGRMSFTSTPMPHQRNGTMENIGSVYSNAFSTPTTRKLPPNRPDSSINKTRHSYLGTTTNIKLTAPSAAATGLKRRTLNGELKDKSPAKSRIGQLNPNSASLSTTMKTINKTPTKMPQNAFKTPANLTSGYTSTSRLSTRNSISGLHKLMKNKENKMS